MAQTNHNTNAPGNGNYAAPQRTLGEAIDVCLRKYYDFTGRASRTEYLWTFAFLSVSAAIPKAAEIILGQHIAGYVAVAVVVLVLPAALAVGARRLHDINLSGWWQLVFVVPTAPFMLLTSGYLNYLADKYPTSQLPLPILILELSYHFYIYGALIIWAYWCLLKKGNSVKNRFDKESFSDC